MPIKTTQLTFTGGLHFEAELLRVEREGLVLVVNPQLGVRDLDHHVSLVD